MNDMNNAKMHSTDFQTSFHNCQNDYRA